MASSTVYLRTPYGIMDVQQAIQIWGIAYLVDAGIGPELAAWIAPETVAVGATSSFTLSSRTFVDTLGAQIGYSATLSDGSALPSWLSYNASSNSFTAAPTSAGTVTVRLIATDTFGLQNSALFTLTAGSAKPATTGSAPTVTNKTPTEYYVAGAAYSLTLPSNTFTDPNRQALTYSASGVPSWLTFNASTDSFSGTAPSSGSFSITVTATDTSKLSVSETFTLKAAAAPVVSAQTGTQYYAAGKTLTLALPSNTFTDPQGATLTYSATANGGSLPSWLKFNTATDTFTGSTASTTGTYTIKVTATDSYGLSTSETFTLSSASGPVVANATGAQSWTQGSKVAFTLPGNTFTDPQGSKLTYTATLAGGAKLPSWLTFNGTTDTFSGTVPTGTSGLSLTVTATDAYGLATSETFAVSTPAPAVTQSGLVINLIYDSSLTALDASTATAAQKALYANIVAAGNTAVAYLEAHFTNNETINVNFGYGEVTGANGVSTAMGSGALGESETTYTRQSYSTVVNALTKADDATGASADQVASLASISGTSSLSSMNFLVATAEARALGISYSSTTSVDGGVGIASAYTFSYNQSSIASGTYDAVGTLEHEITEVMGRTGLLNSGSQGYTPLDLFRYVSAGVHDFTESSSTITASTPEYFSVNGTTMLQQYNNPLNGGDVADWNPSIQGDSFGSGYAGVASLVSNVDLQEMNVIGYTRSSLSA